MIVLFSCVHFFGSGFFFSMSITEHGWKRFNRGFVAALLSIVGISWLLYGGI